MFEDDKTPIFGRTDLRNGVSEAKFDAEADFDVKKCLAPPKSVENLEKPTKKSEKFSEQKFRRQKIESCKSSETRFPEVSRRSERSSRGEQKFGENYSEKSFIGENYNERTLLPGCEGGDLCG